MSGYTPDTDEVRDSLVYLNKYHAKQYGDVDLLVVGSETAAQFDRMIAEVERAAANAVLAELLPVLEDAVSNAYTVQIDRAIGNEMDEELARVEAAVERARAAALGLTAGQERES